MKIKIGSKIIDPNEEPIMLIFKDMHDKKEFSKNIKNMDKDALKFCMCPSKEIMNDEEIIKFMKTE